MSVSSGQLTVTRGKHLTEVAAPPCLLPRVGNYPTGGEEEGKNLQEAIEELRLV